MGPNEGKSFLEQTECVARAAMSYSAVYFSDPIVSEQRVREYEKQHGSLAGRWVQYVNTWGSWYAYYDANAVNHGGISDRELPKGADAAGPIDLRGTEKAFADKFEGAVNLLENGLADGVSTAQFWGIVKENLGDAEPSPVIKEYASIFDEITRHRVENLSRSVAACRPEFNSEKIEGFRDWLRKFPDTSIPQKPHLLLVGDPKRVEEFSKSLAEEHHRYVVDAVLFGSVATVMDICGYCASKAQEKSGRKDSAIFLEVFNNLALSLTSMEDKNPLKILRDTAKRAIEGGFADDLLDIVNKYREIMARKTEEARNSETVDKSLDLLYEAIPYALGALNILTVLHYKEKLDAKVKLLKGSFDMVDEDLVRMYGPFRNQIQDFNGAKWENWKRTIGTARQKDGAEAAEKIVDFVIEQNLFYPRKFAPELRGEESS